MRGGGAMSNGGTSRPAAATSSNPSRLSSLGHEARALQSPLVGDAAQPPPHLRAERVVCGPKQRGGVDARASAEAAAPGNRCRASESAALSPCSLSWVSPHSALLCQLEVEDVCFLMRWVQGIVAVLLARKRHPQGRTGRRSVSDQMFVRYLFSTSLRRPNQQREIVISEQFIDPNALGTA